MRLGDRQFDLRRHAAPVLTAAVGSIVYALRVPPSADLSNQIFRSEIFGDEPFAVWDNRWFGGHHTPGYSLLAPPLGWLLGPLLLGVLSLLAAAFLSSLLTHRLADRDPSLHRPAWGASLLTVGLMTSLYGGRIAFLLGAAFGVGALLAAAGERRAATVVLALAGTAASPVVGLFLALIGAALWLGRGVTRWTAVALAVPPVLLIGSLAVLFPDKGTFPFPIGGMLNSLVATALVAAGTWRYLSVRWACLGYAALCVLVTFAPTPVGGNAARLVALAAPVMVVMSPPIANRIVTAVLVVPLVILQWAPVSMAVTGDRAQTEASFYEPLLTVLADQPQPLRVEVVPVETHDEANFVGREFAMARGWNRQLDRYYHEVLYEDGLTADEYRAWLDENGVSVVAIADTPLDYGGEQEAALLENPPAYLTPIYTDDVWRVYAVQDPQPLASNGATLDALDIDSFTLTADAAGDVPVKVRFSPWFRVTSGDACVREGDDGWTVVEARSAGEITVEASLSFGALLDRDGDC